MFYSTTEYQDDDAPSGSHLYSKNNHGNIGWTIGSGIGSAIGSTFHSKGKQRSTLDELDEEEEEEYDETAAFLDSANNSNSGSKEGKRLTDSTSTVHKSGEMESIGLASTIHNHRQRQIEEEDETEDDDDDDGPPEDIAVEDSSKPQTGDVGDFGMKPFVPIDFVATTNGRTSLSYVPPDIPLPLPNSPKFDLVWSNIYIGVVSFMLATSLMIWLKTDVPTNVPLGDTIYTVLKSSTSTLLTATVLSILISCAWLFVMTRYAHALIYVSVISVPVGLIGLSIYQMVMSYRSAYGGNTSQDKAMRWSSLIPAVCSILWVFIVYKARQVLTKSLGIVRLSCTILSDNKPLILLAFAVIGSFLLISLIWIQMFTRIFLSGHVVRNPSSSYWVLDPTSWALGSLYVFVYLWTWGIISGIQRSTISAVVSQWYFHRHEFPQASAMNILKAAVHYCLVMQFGTICLSSLLELSARLPLFLLPKRLVGFVQMFVYNFVSASVLTLTSPLTLTNAVINSQPLADSARTVGGLQHIDNIGKFSHSWSAYRLSKLLLTTARGLTSLFMGLICWVHAARYTNGGSLYGYIIGLLAGFIGWFVLGSTEGTLSMIVDGVFVCFALDNSSNQGGHCSEADHLFGL